MRKYREERTSIINAININLLPDYLPLSDEISAYQQAYLAGGVTDQDLLDYMVSATGIAGERVGGIMKRTDAVYGARANLAVDNLYAGAESKEMDELIIAGKTTIQDAIDALNKKYIRPV